MAFEKGQSGNIKGRPKKALNKISRDMKVTLNDFLMEKWPEVVKEFDKLEGAAKLKFYAELIPYAVPKMAAMSMDLDITLERLSEQDLDLVIARLLDEQKK